MNHKKHPKTISFTRSPAKHGKSYIITIPKSNIDSGEINTNFFYKITLIPFEKKTATISFTRSPSNIGNTYIIRIPKSNIDSGEVKPNLNYKIVLKPLKKKS